ncbi:HpcH/HpaI aldolase/citrate lyase family protein [Magnetospirillum molischianum]|uniref:ATP/GTP-binding protein n=1 Tax=Magnetospirillum molischianum DSM 120 TaxID=1150626 RepID=H8FWG5_MAGML|nr:HpcH/HpaI aldolase/citrate lyase family protein [Magnetospirillum molischianum]CCG42703.1 ATP/GTP-binding protein [Magnetospirillum molischianum DSM 120]
MTISHLRLGASLYVPATRPDLAAVANGERYPGLKSVILCTEDSIKPSQVEAALGNLRECLPQIATEHPLVFIRPRNAEVLGRILEMTGVGRIDGFVLPKVTRDSLASYAAMVPERFLMMPTVETKEAFDPAAIADLRAAMSEPAIMKRILAVRIGGNDLLNLLGIRRRPRRTIYDTAAGPVVASLVAAFRPFGFPLTAPVFDDFGDAETLNEEVVRDVEHGLVGKTAIHPSQVSRIERHYRVYDADLAMARRVLDGDAPAVFQVDGVMCEPATHSEWARSIVERSEVYGVEGKETFLDRLPVVL